MKDKEPSNEATDVENREPSHVGLSALLGDLSIVEKSAIFLCAVYLPDNLDDFKSLHEIDSSVQVVAKAFLELLKTLRSQRTWISQRDGGSVTIEHSTIHGTHRHGVAGAMDMS